MKYKLTFNDDPIETTGYCEAKEVEYDPFNPPDDYYRKKFEPGATRHEVLVSERQAQSIMDELTIQQLTGKISVPSPLKCRDCVRAALADLATVIAIMVATGVLLVIFIRWANF